MSGEAEPVARQALPLRRGRTGRGPGSTEVGRIRWADDAPVNSEEARSRIVVAALDCVRRFGADKTGMDDVARAAAITRATVYKYFRSRTELMMAVFLQSVHDHVERSLASFFEDATTIDQLHDGVAESSVFLLDSLRRDDAIQAILYGSDISLEVLLREAADLVVARMEAAMGEVIGSAIDQDLSPAVRSFDLDLAAAWIIRLLYAFLVWPGADAAEERAMFRSFLAPAFFRDPS